MCGIFAAINEQSVTKQLLHGLAALSYRGYDSAGIAVMHNGALSRARCEGKLENLEQHLNCNPIDGGVGIAHTRWATHGLPNERNAHPHMTAKVAVVHNGIVENAQQLRDFLEKNGQEFESETDSESIAQLITFYLNSGYDEELALKSALEKIEGSYGLVIMFNDDPNSLYAAKYASPLVIGKSENGLYISSDENALIGLASHVLHLADGELIKLNAHKLTRIDTAEELSKEFEAVSNDQRRSDKGRHNHYMLKEIYEQPEVFNRCWHQYFDKKNNGFKNLDLKIATSHISRISIIACGTSYFAGMVAKQWLETQAGMPVDLEIASEYRYREAPIVGNSVSVFISQSGETADTLAALQHAKAMGQPTIALVNVINSSMAREADLAMPTLAGPEIGVASTKAFMSQLTSLLSLSISVAKANLRFSPADEQLLIKDMQSFANALTQAIEQTEEVIKVAKKLQHKKSALFLGRGPAFALAEEGALKLKEISYIHAEAYAAGELKHGPLALVDKDMPIVVIAPPGKLTAKTISNLREVASRGGEICLISNKQHIEDCQNFIANGIEMAEVNEFLQPLLYCIPLQLIAYHTACLLGHDVDQPRNLAKSVTVE
ncbi:glutamine--fructose-6-phosphate transaminase (isomerizing) [Agaribacterium sp. ZY112]|uniref:glutamine--fructose-6-phosphate transaminase (isomerizing) n=1 Tax=Agaribacterium sp. ZY112 TaxID=3233574 RepID=UPI00352334AF